MHQLIEELVYIAVNVEGSAQGGHVLKLNQNLGPDGRNEKFLDQVSACINGDNDALRGIVALVIAGALVRHALENVQQKAGQ